MKTIKIEGFISKGTSGDYQFFMSDMSEYGYMLVCPHVLEFTLPETFNPVAAEVSMLNKKLDNLQAEHDRAASVIKDRISNLLCLEYTPA